MQQVAQRRMNTSGRQEGEQLTMITAHVMKEIFRVVEEEEDGQTLKTC
jgi:hypothetical protein